MRRTRKTLFAVAIATMMLGALTRVDAIERRPLPGFSLTDMQGQTVESAAIVRGDTWLLVYMTPSCSTCGRLMTEIAGWNAPEVAERVVVIVKADAAAAQEMVSSWPESMRGVPVHLDPSGAAGRALRINGAPTILGLRGPIVEWGLAGVLTHPGALENTLRHWVGRTAPSAIKPGA